MGKFKDLILSGKPVLVDFHATWCGPCKAMAPILEDVKAQVGDVASIIKVDVDRNPQAAQAYGVRGVPTLILFKDSEIKWQASGVRSAQELTQLIQQHA